MLTRPAVHPDKRVSDRISGRGLPVLTGDSLMIRRMEELYYESSDNSGSGSALSSLTAAAASIGSAAISSQINSTQVNPPVSVRPPIQTAPAATSGSSVVVIVLLIVVAGIAAFLYSK